MFLRIPDSAQYELHTLFHLMRYYIHLISFTMWILNIFILETDFCIILFYIIKEIKQKHNKYIKLI